MILITHIVAPLFDAWPLGGPRAYWIVYIQTGSRGGGRSRFSGAKAPLFFAAADEQEGAGKQSEGIAAGSEVHFRDLNAIALAEGKRGNSEEQQGHSDDFGHGGDVHTEAARRQVLEAERKYWQV
ncbi:MAG TPA: hypothetical protein VLM42_09470 [Bryobacteraceae bacterium]|nr:hypothetical protein [Bryobacteraceae bacterium]